jgi:prepilin-type N-terminal cleavage/methylation domain-containing protein
MFNNHLTNNRKKNSRKLLNNANGFSIIELLFAMAVLAFGMLAAASLQYSAIRNNTNGNIYTQANMLAKAQLEFLKNLDIGSANLAVGDYNDGALIDENGQPGGIYNRFWTITQLGTQARRITVTVRWTRLGDSRQVVVSSNTRGSGV